VPFKGSGPAIIDLIAGRVAVYFPPVPSALSQVNAGKLRALGVTSVVSHK
jgi:tripartite-type tricarboxylate transporter receptor subunit TctC